MGTVNRHTIAEIVRVPILLFLLRATGWPLGDLEQARARLSLAETAGPWVTVSVISLAFVVIMLVGRRWHHPGVLLGIEATVAGVVAFVPPFQWVLWFGVGGWQAAAVRGFVQPLAIAWFGVVGATAVWQLDLGGRFNAR